MSKLLSLIVAAVFAASTVTAFAADAPKADDTKKADTKADAKKDAKAPAKKDDTKAPAKKDDTKK
jgi:Ni/Co efflux regulator RcnB